jgi:hypothetical protein
MFFVKEVKSLDSDHFDVVVEGGGQNLGLRFRARYTKTSQRLTLGRSLERRASSLAIGLPDETFDRLEVEIRRAIEEYVHRVSV